MGDDQSGDTLRARAGESRTKLWFLLEADRRLVVAGLVVVTFLALFVAGTYLPGAEETLRESDSVDTLFQGLLTATITGVTLVLTLNQLVLSQELGPLGDQRDRMRGALDFREDAAEILGAPVSPARPSEFLRSLVELAGQRARALGETVEDGDDGSDAVRALTETLTENATQVADDLHGAQFGEFDVLSAALDFDYSWKLFTARRIRNRYDVSEETRDALDRLVDTLELFGPAREHFKTLYFQWELIALSGSILAVTVPALLVAACMIAFFDPTSYPGVLVPVVALATTVSVLPFLVLLVYVIRIATVAKHTLSIGPFILQEAEGIEEVSWADDESR